MPRGRQLFPLAAAITAGIQAVIVLVISQRALTLDEFAPLAQLWAIWAVSAASTNYGFQQWAAIHPAGLGILTTRRGRTLAIGLVVTSVALIAATSLVREDLFSSNSMWWPVLTGSLPLGTAAVGINRGELARTGQTNWLAFVIGGENTLRLVCTLVLAAIGASAPWYGLALMSGFLVAFIPGPHRDYTQVLDLRPLGAAVGAGLVSHVLLFGAPVILALSGGDADDVVRFFLILSAVRAPFVLLQGLIPQIAVRFGQQPNDHNGAARLILGVGAATAVVAFLGGFVLGDPVVGRVFSMVGEVDHTIYGLVAAAGVLSVSLSIVNVQLVATRRLRSLVAAWTIPISATLIALSFGLLDSLGVVATWTLASHVLVVIVLTVLGPGRTVVSRVTRPGLDSLQSPDTGPLGFR